ncbi:uncharacterized protein RBU47_005073 [Passerculus sandwichensis]
MARQRFPALTGQGGRKLYTPLSGNRGRREPRRPCRRSVCPGSEAPGQGIMRGTMVSSPGLLLLAPRQADSEPQLPRASSSRQLAGCHQRGCKAVPEAELPKDLPAVLLMSGEQCVIYSTRRDAGRELEENELFSIPGVVKEPQEKRSATGNRPTRLLGERFRCHPVGTAVLILLSQMLVLALGAALAVLAARQVPGKPAILQCCPFGWLGFNAVCYYFSRDYSTWEQGQERCSELNASLAIAQDEEAMDLLFRLGGNVDFWLGLRRRGERLHWGDGSSYSSR